MIPNSVESGSEMNVGSTIRLEKKDALCLNSAQVLTSFATNDKAARNLSALLNLNIELGKLLGLHPTNLHRLIRTLNIKKSVE